MSIKNENSESFFNTSAASAFFQIKISKVENVITRQTAIRD